MRTKLPIAVLAALALAPVAPPAGAIGSSPRRTQVLCLAVIPGVTVEYVHRAAPKRCEITFRGTRGTGSMRVRDLRWHWGHTRARGTGLGPSNRAGNRSRVRVRLSRPIIRCGGVRVFSRATETFRYPSHTSTRRGAIFVCAGNTPPQ
jgi:hypothetical protein